MHPNVYIPDAFLKHIESHLPSHLTMDDLVSACQRPLRKSIRVNTLKLSIEAFKQRAQDNGWSLQPIPWCSQGFWIDADETHVPLGNTAEHMAGLFYIQEASSMLPPSALFHSTLGSETQPFETVLDMAAAPGSKTTQIAALMNNDGILVANEYASSRVKVLHANIERCGVKNAALSNYDARVFGGWLPERFDAILLDAPCSGEGTIRKDVDAMKNWSLDSTLEIAATQKDLIESAFHALKVGGTLVYSTCALSQEENQQVMFHLKECAGDAVEFESLGNLFADAQLALTNEGFLHVFPQIYDSEGFFIAKVKKVASITPPVVKKRLGKFPFQKLSSKDTEDVTVSLNKTLSVDFPQGSQLWKRDNDIWLFPTALEPLLTEFRFSRMGIKVAEQHKKGYRWQHQVATCLANSSSQTIAVNKSDAREWYMGRDIRPEGLSGTGETFVSYHGIVIGLGKWVGNRIKNGLPRELVRDKNLF
ncbi:16S rRNA (cytosine(1407)-C(5))-methyltransferase RsmF [Vibrio sp. 10N.286.49.C2]|uniref:16S rRNA (cytosine(1407)-C(5))-methyltransferase RsmF n=1 Tax=unclassified Vibrio TaxID=2614977 RepID=UPI000C83615E|nr:MULTISPECIES: 16S rRNA (cytosine(1407)-C(5))-methyltransferase RsmF [unclassified Vibrio]PMH37166.1 16S rRNA (cytosine(1407)-C(5))-methyltransferase RsmF [Vibrio sp. 10N.286.49.C2]PMH57311.1 16S rRNA (cytosine(1407)-C(5))-methyltransferase RsmF [Vibrio sp. 10N.286.49.B1]